MSTTQTAPRDAAIRSGSPSRESTATEGLHPHDAPHSRRPRPNRIPSDDEILGLDSGARRNDAHSSTAPVGETDTERGGSPDEASPEAAPTSAAEPENLRATFDANPELRAAWHDAHSYRESFATPDEARAATALLADLDRLDALFFSRRPEDHAELARAVATLDPEAFASLARAMSAHVSSGNAQNPSVLSSRARPTARPSQSADEGSAVAGGDENQKQIPRTPGRPLQEQQRDGGRPSARNDNPRGSGSSVEGQGFSPATEVGAELPAERQEASPQRQSAGPSTAQIEFFHSTNAAAVRNVLDAIESQVERLLPDGISKSARNRVVGEIYRELDSTLQSNRQLTQQMRDAFRAAFADASGQGAIARPDEGRVGYHQRALVSLITSRARQALPGVAKRVLGEWTSTIVAANHDRRSRQRAAESRVDIAGSGRAGNDGIRPMTPRDLDYARLSDSDILNL
jgi:hypothetical protein